MTTFVLIPCKTLAEGKSRLGADVDAPTRAALCESFLRRTLATARSLVSAQRVRLVTGDPKAADIAQEHGVSVITEQRPGLNEALDLARNVLVATGRASQALILPIDLPLATEATLALPLAAAEDVVVVPDEEDEGTNLLALRSHALRSFQFSFGPASFAKHIAGAKLAGQSVKIICDAELRFDVDRPDQFRRWQALNPA